MKHPALTLSLGLACATAFFQLTGMQGPQAQRLLTLTPEQQEILSHMSIVYLDDGQGGSAKTIRLTGVNVQVVNGLGATNGDPANPSWTEGASLATNSVGNLIVGYDEPYTGPFNRAGSHNLIVGYGHQYSSFGGVTFGWKNKSLSAASGVLGGTNNEASVRPYCAVVGGNGNVADDWQAVVVGGGGNHANEGGAVVVGGANNTALGGASVIVGGYMNQTIRSHSQAVLVGGERNTCGGNYAVLSGGSYRSTTGTHDWVAGSLFEDN